MSSYKSVPTVFTIDEALDKVEIEDLRDEMQGWLDNMSGTALENTNRYSMAEEAVSQLDDVDNIDFDELWDVIPEDGLITADELKALSVTCYLFEPKNRKSSPSRAYRLSNAIAHITAGLEAIRDYIEDKLSGATEVPQDIQAIINTLDEIADTVANLDGVDFPGMFG